MHLTEHEKSMLNGSEGPVIAEAMDYLIQFGEAFGAEKLADITYCHYPAEMAIYEGNVEDAAEYAARGGKVKVPTTNSTLCCDLEKPYITGCPAGLIELQSMISPAHKSMGIDETYTCTPQHLGYLPPFGSYNALVESSAIIYYNSVLGAKTNRGGLFTRFSAITGKYPLMGYLLDENRKGTMLFKVQVSDEFLKTYDGWSALGMYIGSIVGSGVPVIEVKKPEDDSFLLGLGAALATSGSVTLFHIPGVTPEAPSTESAFHGPVPEDFITVTDETILNVYRKQTNITEGSEIDFVTLGCPHYTLEQIGYVAEKLKDRKINEKVRFWVCTSRKIRSLAQNAGYIDIIENAGAKVVCDTCPVESHMRISTCRDFNLEVPNIKSMVCDSGKMIRYVGDLIGCKTALANRDKCIECAITGRWE